MNDKKVYLAGTIEVLEFKELEWFFEAAEILRDIGMDVYNPCDHIPEEMRNGVITAERVKEAGGSKGKEIVAQDLFHLQGSNIFLINLKHGCSTGKMTEFGIKWAQGATIVAFGGSSNHPFISELANVVYDTLDEAVDFIVNL